MSADRKRVIASAKYAKNYNSERFPAFSQKLCIQVLIAKLFQVSSLMKAVDTKKKKKMPRIWI